MNMVIREMGIMVEESTIWGIHHRRVKVESIMMKNSKATTIVSLTHDSKHMVWNGKKKQQWPYGHFSKSCRYPILLEFVIISNRPGNRDKA